MGRKLDIIHGIVIGIDCNVCYACKIDNNRCSAVSPSYSFDEFVNEITI